MSDQDALIPRVLLVRHGETEWARSGRYTSHTDIGLTPEGIAQLSSMAAKIVGAGNLLDPSRLEHIFVSPRKRARETFKLLLRGSSGGAQWEERVTYTEDIAEWNYGDYEGLLVNEIRELRKKKGLDCERQWDIWRDGSMWQVTERLDGLISRIREIQTPYMNGAKPADVLIVAHGLVLRCFIKRWLGFSVDFPLQMKMDPGAITVLSYKNHEPAIHISIALPFTDGSTCR
ncbi:putative phosphoglycerate mutase [Thermothelomyces heterothallicus CBS 202.75]|uniref:putative phosphoglycerate mutase n=1 Tax=Thermothelomyces heterothallicus CBS 202.75 TaxID=1149848 RepID=UPI00374399F7